ncbi:VanZ family protein [Spirosoma rhododendri]|uniref:VanZ family protein n=2 Tax=Spirosoma rhododendri TaxID=2728024 RepID=A0A7L5DZ02_9BACT|nr:VanZ family protein [Spirosoma rhododendri]
MIFKKLLLIAAIGWTIIMFIGCSWPGESVPESLSNRDKLTHIAIFAAFGFLWRLAGQSTVKVLLAGILYGVLIEIWQGIMPINRSCDLADAVADTAGVCIGILLALPINRYLSKVV